MAELMGDKPHITFLFSDTGGGHRAASEAIIEAIHCEFGESVITQMVDFLKDYAPPPFNHLPEVYPDMVRVPELWGAMFDISDGRPQARIVTSTFWPIVRKAARKLAYDHHSDLIVSVHPLANSFTLKALGKERPPFITVVTDLVTTHALWFDKRADLIIVPTEMARQHALKYSMSPEKVQVIGLPIMRSCTNPQKNKLLLRKKLGWPTEKLTVLLVGGGEGMGPLSETAMAIDESELDLSLIIVAGRNTKLETELNEREWKKPARIYGFTHEMPTFMNAADVIVTKAGPGTIAEALVAGLPIILYDKIPGQEDGNVDYVIAEKVGIWAPEPESVVDSLRDWANQPEELEIIAENCRRTARPDASHQIALILGERIGLFPQGERSNKLFMK
jgi:1,2-diacylglycerol 3-beta-galactosyltransferase